MQHGALWENTGGALGKLWGSFGKALGSGEALEKLWRSCREALGDHWGSFFLLLLLQEVPGGPQEVPRTGGPQEVSRRTSWGFLKPPGASWGLLVLLGFLWPPRVAWDFLVCDKLVTRACVINGNQGL